MPIEIPTKWEYIKYRIQCSQTDDVYTKEIKEKMLIYASEILYKLIESGMNINTLYWIKSYKQGSYWDDIADLATNPETCLCCLTYNKAYKANFSKTFDEPCEGCPLYVKVEPLEGFDCGEAYNKLIDLLEEYNEYV